MPCKPGSCPINYACNRKSKRCVKKQTTKKQTKKATQPKMSAIQIQIQQRRERERDENRKRKEQAISLVDSIEKYVADKYNEYVKIYSFRLGKNDDNDLVFSVIIRYEKDIHINIMVLFNEELKYGQIGYIVENNNDSSGRIRFWLVADVVDSTISQLNKHKITKEEIETGTTLLHMDAKSVKRVYTLMNDVWIKIYRKCKTHKIREY